MAVETAKAARKEGATSDPVRVGVIGSGSVAQKYIPHMQRMNIPRQRVDITVVCDPVERQWDDGPPRTIPHQRSGGPDHLLGVEHLVECLSSGARPIPSIDHAIHVIEIMEAASRSAAAGHAVDLETTFV